LYYIPVVYNFYRCVHLIYFLLSHSLCRRNHSCSQLGGYRIWYGWFNHTKENRRRKSSPDSCLDRD